MNNKNNQTIEQVIAARNLFIAEQNRKAVEIAKKNLAASPYRH